MKMKRTLIAMLGLTTMTALTAGLIAQDMSPGVAPPKSEKKVEAEIGKAAPAFTLKDTEGEEHSLADYKNKIVVLEWINPKCPVCVRVMSTGIVKQMRDELKKLDKDIVHLAINSTHFMEAKDTKDYLAKYEMEIPGLIDKDGTVGQLYVAKTTPHMYVIDKQGILRYNGAIDDDNPGGSKGKDATNYVVNAVRQIVNGETVAPDTTKPYGCEVKYASANKPRGERPMGGKRDR